jgi:3-methylcrotonyl-CoA carboxylase alpha subunit
MELTVKAPRDGVVSELRAVAGDFVEADAVLAVVAAVVPEAPDHV